MWKLTDEPRLPITCFGRAVTLSLRVTEIDSMSGGSRRKLGDTDQREPVWLLTLASLVSCYIVLYILTWFLVCITGPSLQRSVFDTRIIANGLLSAIPLAVLSWVRMKCSSGTQVVRGVTTLVAGAVLAVLCFEPNNPEVIDRIASIILGICALLLVRPLASLI